MNPENGGIWSSLRTPEPPGARGHPDLWMPLSLNARCDWRFDVGEEVSVAFQFNPAPVLDADPVMARPVPKQKVPSPFCSLYKWCPLTSLLSSLINHSFNLHGPQEPKLPSQQ